MGWLIPTLVVLAVVASLAVAIEAVRRPILFRMAARNAGRRPRQTATVVAGLMVGTAIISAALVAGASAGSAIRGAVYDALGDVDETVRMDAFNFYPESVLDTYLADPAIADYFDGISANVIWDAAVTNTATDLFEPDVAIVGYDGERDKDFRPFHFTDGTRTDGTGLARGTGYITKALADATDAKVGDTLSLHYTPPRDPLLPNVTLLGGTLTTAGGDLLGTLAPALGPSPADDTTMVPVDANAQRFVAVIAWNPTVAGVPVTQLTLRVTAPDGSTWSAPATTPVTPEVPLVVDVAAPDGADLEPGTWSVTISATISANTAYQGAALVLYPVYDIEELQDRARALGDMDLGPFEDAVDALDPFQDPETLELTVAGITDGGRGDQFDFEVAVFIDFEDAQDAFHRQDQINVIKFSNPGGIVSGRAGTDRAVELLNGTLTTLKGQGSDPAIQELKVFPVKENYVQLADDAGQFLTGLLLFAGSLSVITGLLLIINIFTMLAEERRSELGMARAVGLSRRDLVRLFLFEGSLYAVAAAAIGAFLGLGLAYVMILGLNAILADFGGTFPPIPFQARPTLLLAAFASGALLTFVTIAFASRRIARLNIVRAIRQIDEPEKSAAFWQVLVGIPLVAVSLAVTTAGWFLAAQTGGFTLQVLGAVGITVGTGLILRRWVKRATLYPALAGVLAAYYTATYFAIKEYADIQEANIIGPIRGVLLTLCVVVIVVHVRAIPRGIGWLLGRSRRLRPIAVPAVGYPQHKRFRTGMTLAMFSIVILSIGFFSIFGGLFERPAETQTGGFHIEATTTLDVESLDAYDRGLVPAGVIEHEVRITEFTTLDATFLTVNGERTGHFGPPHHHVYGVGQDFVEAQNFRLLWRLAEYPDDAAAYQAMLQGDGIIVAYTYSTDEAGRDLSHKVGETLQIHLGDTPREYTILGIQEQYHFPGVFLPRDDVEDMFPTTNEAFYLYRLADGVDHEATAKLLEKNYRDVGMDAEASEVLVNKEQETFNQVLGAMKLFLGLGLIVGVLSLGIVTSRSVIERRQEIGMLRALGFTRTMIRRIFFTEVTLTVVLGAAIGIACSIVVSFGLWYSIIRELNYPYQIPWGEIFVTLGISYVVALMATAAPIRRAARVAPAEALRYID